MKSLGFIPCSNIRLGLYSNNVGVFLCFVKKSLPPSKIKGSCPKASICIISNCGNSFKKSNCVNLIFLFLLLIYCITLIRRGEKSRRTVLYAGILI